MVRFIDVASTFPYTCSVSLPAPPSKVSPAVASVAVLVESS